MFSDKLFYGILVPHRKEKKKLRKVENLTRMYRKFLTIETLTFSPYFFSDENIF